MATVLLYTTASCPYCGRAIHLLERKGVDYEERRIDRDAAEREVMVARSGRHTVPQIFIGEYHVGGYDDLARLEGAGQLDRLLGR